MYTTLKKSLLCALTTLALPLAVSAATIETSSPQAVSQPEITVLLPGYAHDNGFMEAGYRGYEALAKTVSPNVKCVSDVSATSDAAALTAELEKLAQEQPKLIIAHGGQLNGPVEQVSKNHQAIQFVVIQGNIKGDNVSSYVVDQEQSAFLAGALAGYMTKTNKVGHISGAWPQPGLRARAAFYDGLHYANPQAEFYSTFTGNLDDRTINEAAATAQIEAGCDVIYTMLNGGRNGVNDAIAKTQGKVSEIGNVIDWTKESSIFIGSAVADSSVAIAKAGADYKQGTLTGNRITKIGLEDPAVVRLALANRIPTDVAAKLTALQQKVEAQEIQIQTTYTGPEFDPEHHTFVDQDAKNHRP